VARGGRRGRTATAAPPRIATGSSQGRQLGSRTYSGVLSGGWPAVAARWLLAVVAGMLAFSLPFLLPDYALGLQWGLVFRGVLAGLVSAMTLEPDDPLWSAPVLAAAAALGATLLFRSSPAVVAVPFGFYLFGVITASATATATLLLSKAGLRRLAALLSVVAVCVTFLWSIGYLPGPFVPAHENQLASVLPSSEIAPDSYEFDGLLFMRTTQLMRSGVPYYSAFEQATREDARFPPDFRFASVFNVREPFMFFVWAALPGSSGRDFYVAFIVFALIVGTASYGIGARFVRAGPALVGMIAVLAYLEAFVLASNAWFMFMEIWAGGFLVLSVWAFCRRRLFLSALLLLAAVATREFMVVVIPVWVLVWWIYPKRSDEWPALITATAAPILALAAHLAIASAYVTTPAGGGDVTRWLQASWDRWFAALEFGLTDSVVTSRLIYIALSAAVVGAFLTRRWWQRALLAGAILAPVILLRAISGGDQSTYWGYIAVPLILSAAPIVATRIVPSTSALLEAGVERKLPGKVRFVIPVRDASSRIGPVLDGIGSAMQEIGLAYAVVVVDD
jgi:hypothetical protein